MRYCRKVNAQSQLLGLEFKDRLDILHVGELFWGLESAALLSRDIEN